MSSEEEIIEEAKEGKEEPMQVKVVNVEPKESSPYDGHDHEDYDEVSITEDEIKEFEDGDSSSK